MNQVEWTGNPLRREGTRGKLGPIEAELMHIDPAVFGFQFVNGKMHTTHELRRTWVLGIYDTRIISYAADDACISTVVLVNLMPEPAKREAEQLIEWAAIARDAIVEVIE